MTNYRVQRRIGVSGPFVDHAVPATNSFTDSALAPSTTYQVQVRAEDAAGNASAYSAVASGSTTAVGATRLAFNAALPDYYDMHDLHINLIHDTAHQDWQDEGANRVDSATGWIVGLLPGERARRLIKLALPEAPVYMRPGAYKATTTGGGTVNVIPWSGGITGVTPGVNLCTFNVQSNGGSLKPEFSVVVTNNTASPINIPKEDLKVYAVSLESQLLAGEIFDPVPIVEHQRAAVTRAAGLTGTLGEQYTPATLPDDDTWITGAWPHKHFARFAKKLGTEMWINPPCIMDVAYYDADPGTDRLTITDYISNPIAMPWSNGDRICLMLNTPLSPGPAILPMGVYYVRNISGSTFQVSDTASSAILDVTTAVSNSTDPDNRYAYLITKLYDYETIWTQLAQDLYDVYPECTKVHVAGLNETWNTGGGFYKHFAFCIGPAYYHANGTRNTSNDSGPGHSYLSLQIWKIFEDIWGRSKVKRVFEAQTWPGNRIGALDFVDPGVIQAGQPTYNLLDTVAVAPYIYPSQNVWNASYGSWEVDTVTTMIASSAWLRTPTQWYDSLARTCSDIAGLLSQWRVVLNARRPNVPLTTYELGQHVWQQISVVTNNDADKVKTAWRNYWFGPDGAAGRALYKSAIFDAYQIQEFSQYNCAGTWFDPPCNYVQQWGAKQFYDTAYDNDYWDWMISNFASS